MKPRGVLHLQAARDKLRVDLHEPGPDFRVFVEHHWIVEWDLAGRDPHVQENLPHPSVHLVLEADGARIHGVPRRRFTRVLRDRGRVHGVKFRPGAFHPFVKVPVARFTDRVVEASAVLGPAVEGLAGDVLRADHAAMIERVEDALRPLLPEPDDNVRTIADIVEDIASDPTVTKVDAVVSRTGINKRMLQRLFQRYVGVSPKWVIQRYRLIEAVERVDGREDVDWARLALDLGYADQAHFIRHFRAVIGKPPGRYAAAVR